MKKIIIHISILIIVIFLTSFDAERSNFYTSNFYEIGENTFAQSLIVTKFDEKGNNNYYYYNEAGQLTRIDYNENVNRTFSYNSSRQLVGSELYKGNDLVDKETIDWSSNKITKTDFDLVRKEWKASYKEEYVLSPFGQVTEIIGFVNSDENIWKETGNSIQYTWDYEKLLSIENTGNSFEKSIELIEKLDIFSDLEYAKTKRNAKKSTKEIVQVAFSNDINFTPFSGKLFDISNLINNNTSTLYISFWNNGKRKEIVRYHLDTESYPLQFDIQITDNSSKKTSINYSVELI